MILTSSKLLRLSFRPEAASKHRLIIRKDLHEFIDDEKADSSSPFFSHAYHELRNHKKTIQRSQWVNIRRDFFLKKTSEKTVTNDWSLLLADSSCISLSSLLYNREKWRKKTCYPSSWLEMMFWCLFSQKEVTTANPTLNVNSVSEVVTQSCVSHTHHHGIIFPASLFEVFPHIPWNLVFQVHPVSGMRRQLIDHEEWGASWEGS